MNFLPHIAHKIPEQLSYFLGKLSLPKKTKDFIFQATYGIMARQSVRLTEIARSLNEPIKLSKTVQRLSNQIRKRSLERLITEEVVRSSASRITDKTLLVIDTSDITKKYAQAMEHLAHVRDGSESKIREGYWLLSIIGVECDGLDITPLCKHLWSQESPDHKSENHEILTCVDHVTEGLEGRGIWVMDRGGDRSRFYEQLIRREQNFIMRLIGNRNLVYRGKSILAEQIAENCPLPYCERVVRQKKDGSEQTYDLSFGVRRVSLPRYAKKPLWMVVVKGFGKKPLMILTTEPVKKSYKSVRWILRAYLTRWRIEDTIRFMKQSYQLEDVRLLKYRSLQNLMPLILLVMSFTMTRLGSGNKLQILAEHALRSSKRLFGIPDFRYYALADGLKELLSSLRKPISRKPVKKKSDPQLYLPNFQPP